MQSGNSPHAKLHPPTLATPAPSSGKRFGFMAGQISVPDDFGRMGDDTIAGLFDAPKPSKIHQQRNPHPSMTPPPPPGAHDAIAPLFERLPPELFRPLAASNGRRYWNLLCRLIDEMWGDGARSPGEEAPRQVLVRKLETLLAADDPWEEALDTPINNRANEILRTLIESGWLSQRRRGVAEMVTLPR